MILERPKAKISVHIYRREDGTQVGQLHFSNLASCLNHLNLFRSADMEEYKVMINRNDLEVEYQVES